MATTTPFTDWGAIAARIAAANKPPVGNHITLMTATRDGVELLTHMTIDGVHVDIADDAPLVVERLGDSGIMMVTATMFAGQLSTKTVPV